MESVYQVKFTATDRDGFRLGMLAFKNGEYTSGYANREFLTTLSAGQKLDVLFWAYPNTSTILLSNQTAAYELRYFTKKTSADPWVSNTLTGSMSYYQMQYYIEIAKTSLKVPSKETPHLESLIISTDNSRVSGLRLHGPRTFVPTLTVPLSELPSQDTDF